MDKLKFGNKSLSLNRMKERVHNVQQEFSASWKTIADKAKKEAKIVNRKARKALATEDGGDLRDEYVLTVNLDAGHLLFKRYQENWALMHNESIKNIQKVETSEHEISAFVKQFEKWKEFLDEFHSNLLILPDVIGKIEIAQNRIEVIGKQNRKIEELILEYEDACERCEFEKQKVELRVKLSQLVETKHAEYTLKKSLLYGSPATTETSVAESEIEEYEGTPPPMIKPRELERQQSAEKQKAYEDAFLDQMNQYIKYGELERPIAGSVTDKVTRSIEDIQIDDSDLSTLREFLGPEQLQPVLQAAQSNTMRQNAFCDTLETEKKDDDMPGDLAAIAVDSVHDAIGTDAELYCSKQMDLTDNDNEAVEIVSNQQAKSLESSHDETATVEFINDK